MRSAAGDPGEALGTLPEMAAGRGAQTINADSSAYRRQREAVYVPLGRPKVPVVERRGDRVDAMVPGKRDDGGVDDADR
jgi:hypothetical protein